MDGDGDFNAAGGGRGSAGRRRGGQVRGSRGWETQSGAPVRRSRQEFVAEGLTAGAAPASWWVRQGGCAAARRRRLLPLLRQEGDDVPRPDHPSPGNGEATNNGILF